ncbi:MAG TPA: AAA family ATPase [Longimicrobium sp.]|nr:AAA family ATPase [Longimicrobium sp.]
MSGFMDALRNAAQSELFAGGLALTLLGAVLATCRKVPWALGKLVVRQVTTCIEVPSTDPLFPRVSLYLDQHPDTRHSRLLTATLNRSGQGKGEESQERVLFAPAPGAHLLWFNRRPVLLTRERKDAPATQGERGAFVETFIFRSPGRDSAELRRIVSAALNAKPDGVEVYAVRYGDWRRLTTIQPRALDSVILPAGQLERITRDIEEFIAARDWYVSRGIPWRRGHLYEGPPGTGKTSLVAALAGRFDLPLYIAALSDEYLTDERLLNSLQDMQERCVLLLEDVDAVCRGREMSGDGKGVTYAGLLNALDGVASKAGTLTIMTTNHPEVLDEALVRRGRVDLVERLDVATAEQAARLFLHFYHDTPGAAVCADDFGRRAVGKSPASLQGVLMDHKHDPTGAVAALSPLNVQQARAA